MGAHTWPTSWRLPWILRDDGGDVMSSSVFPRGRASHSAPGALRG
eukprot:CAMPEP_0170429044 /NCGR_PEP_ID=MMETSP0117_2-20130122/40094_1 /TAXON_ID=400756 /ORGANISM="Durinskia baltica, Strain CSIRO CS-38" /LENGTH=44 /DNA_ID= /DNA_START= /DNA_END= /DNA_ORIENTATION=